MPGQGRLGDKAAVQLDAHGCPACPHPGTGPAIQGSPDVNVNRRPALRVDDPGIHAACCGANTWTAKVGSATVLINGKAAHRMGDLTRHCGGVGQLVEGSPNVIVGESSAGGGGHANGGGGSAARSASSGTASSAPSATSRTSAAPPATAAPATPAHRPEPDRTHQVELELVDADGQPLAGAAYELTASDGSVHKGTLGATGKARVERLPEGTCEVTFTNLGKNPRSRA